MNFSRRDVMKLGSGAAALWASGLRGAPAPAAAGKKIPIALQLYSLRDVCGKDVPGTLAAVAKMGYQGVEFAGTYGMKAEDLDKILDQSGLRCCGTHLGIGDLLGKQLKRTVDFYLALGAPFLIISYLEAKKYLATPQAIQDTAKLLTEVGAKVQPQGLRVGYHSHGQDFQKIGGKTRWELLFTHAGPEVVMQLDVGNCLDGGGDPVAVLKEFPGRALTIHIKEHGGRRGAPIGEGKVHWPDIFRICETTGGTRWYVLEQEAYAGSPLESVKQCIQNMRKMGK